MRSASGWAAWCFHNFTNACGRSLYSARCDNGVPSASVGTIVQAVKSVPMPITSPASTPESASAPRTAAVIDST